MNIPILQEIWDGIRSFFDWFIHTAPKPMRTAFFLFLLVFVIPNIINIILKVPFACVDAPICGDNETHLIYKFKDQGISGLELRFRAEDYLVTMQQESCEYIDNETGKGAFNPIGKFAVTLARWLGIAKQEDLIYIFYNCTNATGGSNERTMTLREFYELSDIPTDCSQHTDKILNVGCHEYIPYLRFYDSDVNIFDYRIWFIIATVMSLIPFAISWYGLILKK